MQAKQKARKSRIVKPSPDENGLDFVIWGLIELKWTWRKEIRNIVPKP
jgi:hypothetical protein